MQRFHSYGLNSRNREESHFIILEFLKRQSEIMRALNILYHSIRLCTRNLEHFTEFESDYREPRYELSLNFFEGRFIFTLHKVSGHNFVPDCQIPKSYGSF